MDIPVQAKVLRRMPCARTSLGTIQYLDDIWIQKEVSSSNAGPPSPANAMNMLHGVGTRGTSAEKAYLDSFAGKVHNEAQNRGVRFVPKTGLVEMNEPLPTMMTDGVDTQYYWCDRCRAYKS